jgi:methionyl-tRNA synthetase
LYAEREDFVAPRTRYNEALSFLRSGLRDVPLSRHKLTWGVPVPWDEEHVFYVWFDALLNYYSALSYARPGEDLTDEFWPASYHVIAKDILRFHAIYWPALLMAAGLELPERIFVHGYLLMDGEKMSKLLGNVLDPFEVIERFGADALRFYLLRDVPFGQDGSVSTGAFEQRYASELANDFGNLASRTLAMIVRYRDGVVLAGEMDPVLLPDFGGLTARVEELIGKAELTLALEEIWERVRRLNRYVEEQAPWQLAKVQSRAGDLDRVLGTLAEGLRVVAVLLWPYLPASSERLLTALGADDLSLAGATFGAGRIERVSKIESLFPKDA